MSLIKIYRTPTTTNERLPTEQQNGYHGVATEQFIEGDLIIYIYIYINICILQQTQSKHKVMHCVPCIIIIMQNNISNHNYVTQFN